MEFIARPTQNPPQRQILGHPNGELALFGEEQEVLRRKTSQQLFPFFPRGNDLHRIETVELAPRLDLKDLGCGKCLPPSSGQAIRQQIVKPQPGRVGRRSRRVVLDFVFRLGGVDLTGQVIKVVLAWNRLRLKNHLGEFAGNFDPRDVSQLLASLGVDEEDILLFGSQVSPPPGDMSPHGIGLVRDADSDTNVSHFRGPARPDSVGKHLNSTVPLRPDCLCNRGGQRSLQELSPFHLRPLEVHCSCRPRCSWRSRVPARVPGTRHRWNSAYHSGLVCSTDFRFHFPTGR